MDSHCNPNLSGVGSFQPYPSLSSTNFVRHVLISKRHRRGEPHMPTDNKAIVRRLYEEVWNKRKLEVVDELISPSHALNDPIVSGSQTGPELYKRRVVEFTASFLDLRFTIEDMIAEK